MPSVTARGAHVSPFQVRSREDRCFLIVVRVRGDLDLVKPGKVTDKKKVFRLHWNVSLGKLREHVIGNLNGEIPDAARAHIVVNKAEWGVRLPVSDICQGLARGLVTNSGYGTVRRGPIGQEPEPVAGNLIHNMVISFERRGPCVHDRSGLPES